MRQNEIDNRTGKPPRTSNDKPTWQWTSSLFARSMFYRASWILHDKDDYRFLFYRRINPKQKMSILEV